MKQYLTYLFLYSAIACHFRTDNKKLSGILKMPSFKILSIDSATCINSDNIPFGSSTVFMYFDPTCEHCEREARAISRNITALKKAKIYLVSNDTSKEVNQFYIRNRLDTIMNVFVGKDYNFSFYRAFLPPTVPYMAIYNSKKKLVKLYKGETNIESIINATQD